MAKIPISKLPKATIAGAIDEVPVVQDGVTKKVAIEDIGKEVNEAQEYSDLESTDKTIIGAINEISSSLESKAEANSVYTKEETYSKTEVDTNLARQVHDAVVEELEDHGAEDTGYDNSESGLEATNVQDAIDEVNTKIENIPSVDAYTKEEANDKFATKTALQTVANAVEGKASVSDLQTLEDSIQNDYAQKLTQTLKVGDNILTEASVVLGANWSGTLANGISHSSGSTASLEFNVPTTYGKTYLVTFDATGVNNTTALNVKIGNTPLVDVYTRRTDFVVGFVSDGGNLIFTPQSNYSGTITNLKLREVTDEGNEVTFTVKNVDTKADNSGVSGFWNVALGFSSFENNINGSRNVAIGFESLQAFQSGTRNLALGTYAMNRLESGDRNIAVGADSMWYAKKATDCIAFGHNAMSGVGDGIENDIAIGRDSLGGLTTGKNNVAIGFQALLSPQSNNVSNATAIGANAGNYGHTYGTYIGNRAGYFMKGISNTCIGYGSGAQQNASGARNTFVGATCGIDNTGATAQNPKNVDDSIVIGYGAKATKSKQAMFGSADITEVVFCGNKKINFNQDGTVTWETLT